MLAVKELGPAQRGGFKNMVHWWDGLHSPEDFPDALRGSWAWATMQWQCHSDHHHDVH